MATSESDGSLEPATPPYTLGEAAIYDILERGAPILGPIEDCTKIGRLSDWMASFPDKTELVQMNIPGTHDTCTWNYTEEVQESLRRYTGPIFDWRVFRCQRSSIFKMLNDGIRFLDLRYAWNPDLETIGFYHAQALLSPTTRMEDVLFGLYHWISLHPSETILVSMKYEPGSGTENDAKLQERIHSILTSKLAKRYWAQRSGSRAMDPDLHPDQLYISFASASFRTEVPQLTPETYAVGDSAENMQGINSRLLEWLSDHREKRLGVVLLDFYEVVPGLVKAIIGNPEKVVSRF